MAKPGKDSRTGLSNWLQGRQPQWQRLEELLQLQRGRRDKSADDVLEFVQAYRNLARDVSLARRNMRDSRITRYLEALLTSCFDLVHRPPHGFGQQLASLFLYDVPREVRNLRMPVLASFLIFSCSGLAGWWLVHTFPELAALFASEAMIDGVQRGNLWTDDILNVVPSSVMSLAIMTNNIMVTFFAFALGAFYGVGTLYIMSLNGLMLGAVFAFTGQYGLDGRLFEFVVAHGVVELSIIVLAGGAGIRLGEALTRPGQRTRAEAFQSAVAQASRLVAVGVPFLIGAGLIEGFVSPNPDYGVWLKTLVGVSYGVLMLLVLSGRVWKALPLRPDPAAIKRDAAP